MSDRVVSDVGTQPSGLALHGLFGIAGRCGPCND